MKQKIAVLGGGVGSLSAVFGITSAPNWQDRFEIDVYQLGWRLGGKCATGRNLKEHARIEEHGLHVWGGYYENAFAMMRKCYEELHRPPNAPLSTWEQAFKKQSLITIEEYINGQWLNWNLNPPENNELPGAGAETPSFGSYLYMALKMAGHFIEQHVKNMVAKGVKILTVAETVAIAALTATSLEVLVAHDEEVLARIESMISEIKESLRPSEDFLNADDTARRIWIILDLTVAHILGFIHDGVLFKGWQAVEDIEWSAWLQKHKADKTTIDSALVRCIYNTIFGFKDGDPSGFVEGDLNCRAISANSVVYGVYRFALTYKGAIFWEMQAGMGETVLTPIYQVLKNRGVRFHFFNRVKNLGVSGNTINTISLGVQVTMKNGDYYPLVSVKDLDCWPSEPFYDQIVEGDELKKQNIDLESAWTPWKDVGERTLTAGTDFDLVILGISAGGLGEICGELMEANPNWEKMVNGLQTVQTLATQLWLTPDRSGLGWEFDPTMLTAYVEPVDTWADLSHLINMEAWGDNNPPQSAAYFCGPLVTPPMLPPKGDYGFPARELEVVQGKADTFFSNNIGHLWPKATLPGSQALNPALVVSSYYRANVNPSDRYVGCIPGTNVLRLEADKSGFANLYVAGDWVFNSLNYGCIEATVMTGFTAARAICGYPEKIMGHYGQRKT